MQPCVYILANRYNGTLYIGVTSDLIKRIWQHKEGKSENFSQNYDLKRLVYFETHESMYQAIQKEKQLKKWNRAWKIRLIESMNPTWRDLFNEIL